jgi:1-acyl-sn-glycerol-3-phosphate acyltransferase
MRRARDWLFTIPTVAAFGLTLGVFHLIGLCALPFGQRPFEKVMAGLQRTLLGVFRIAGIKVVTEGVDGFSPSAGYIFVSNHQSMYDVPIFGGLLPRNYPKYVAKKQLARGLPSVSLNLRHGGNALIDRDHLEQAMDAIAEMASEAERRDGRNREEPVSGVSHGVLVSLCKKLISASLTCWGCSCCVQ